MRSRTLTAGTKHTAYEIVIEAQRYGMLRSERECSVCGKRADTVGHHDDYFYPLSVRWMCVKCHTAQHARLPREPRELGHKKPAARALRTFDMMTAYAIPTIVVAKRMGLPLGKVRSWRYVRTPPTHKEAASFARAVRALTQCSPYAKHHPWDQALWDEYRPFLDAAKKFRTEANRLHAGFSIALEFRDMDPAVDKYKGKK